MSARIGFLGAGKMATALAKGWINADLIEPKQLMASDPLDVARQRFAQETRGRVTHDNEELLGNSDVIVLAVKPQIMMDLLDGIRAHVTTEHLVVSIAAGISTFQLQDNLTPSCRLVRVMPNTPSVVGECAAAYCFNDRATAEDVDLIHRLLNAVGRAFALPESLMDAVTGLSGSGPAFVALMIEAMTDGGVQMGLPRDVASVLVAQTFLGTAKLILDTGTHPAQLKDAVASPGGTTIAGLREMELRAVRGALIEAVQAATLRSKELGAIEQR